MPEQASRDAVEDLVERLRTRVGADLQTVGVGWGPDEIEYFHVRDDVRELYEEEALEDIGVDLLADRHLEVGNMRRHGLEGPRYSGRLYDQVLLVVSWIAGWPVAVGTDPDPDHFPTVVEALDDAMVRTA